MSQSHSTAWRATLIGAALALTALATPAAASGGCNQVRQLGAEGYSAAEIADALGAPLSAVQGCFVAPRQAMPQSQIAPPGRAVGSAAGPAPFGAAGPAPFGAAGPAPFGAAGPAPFGAAGPAPFGAAGGASGTTSTTSKKALTTKP